MNDDIRPIERLGYSSLCFLYCLGRGKLTRARFVAAGIFRALALILI
jgi:hypothetical protein